MRKAAAVGSNGNLHSERAWREPLVAGGRANERSTGHAGLIAAPGGQGLYLDPLERLAPTPPWDQSAPGADFGRAMRSAVVGVARWLTGRGRRARIAAGVPTPVAGGLSIADT